jgi:transposase InsO family protein
MRCDGRRLRLLAIVDDCRRECLALEVDTSITGTRVVAVLERLADLRGLQSVSCKEWFGQGERGRITNCGLRPRAVLNRGAR